MPDLPVATARCACGAVALEARGAPAVVAACHCADCQAGGRQLEALPGAPRLLGPGAGTDYVMVRRDRARVAKGAGRLQAHQLRPGSGTRRVVASCCGTPMYLDVASAPWIPLYRDRLGAGAPPLEMRVNTHAAPPGSLPDDGVPQHRRASAGFVARVLAAGIGLLLHPARPRLRWPPTAA